MPWLKVSDRFATHPIWAKLRTVRHSDERTVNEVIGFVTRCATQASGHMTDYYVDLETAEMMGKGRTDLLLKQAVAAGMLTVSGKGPTRRWRIVEDEDLWQMRARADVMWERQRDKDRKNPDLTMPVLKRDGDVCRYCGKVVNWKDTRSGRGGTFDHSEPAQPATIDTYFVSCRRDNSRRLNNPNADQDIPRRPAPDLPYFSSASGTLERLEKFYGCSIPHVDHERPDSDTAHRDPATSRSTRPTRPASLADNATTTVRPDDDNAQASTPQNNAIATTPHELEDTARCATPNARWDTAAPATPGTGEDTARRATPAPAWATERPTDHSGTTPGTGVVEGWSPGTGRDGEGRDGAGLDGSPPDQEDPKTPRKRARRGNRSS